MSRNVGFASVDIRQGMGNEHMAWVEDVFVLGEERRRGAGRALFDVAVEMARAADRTLVLGALHEGGGGGEAFAAAVGARTANREHQNRVAVAGLDRAMLERWMASSTSD